MCKLSISKKNTPSLYDLASLYQVEGV